MGKATREELNRLGREWYEAGEEKKAQLAVSVFSVANELFGKRAYELADDDEEAPLFTDALGEFFIRDWRHFDPNKGDLSSFMEERLSLRKKDMDRKDNGRHRLTDKDGKRYWSEDISLDMPVEENGDDTFGDLMEDERLAASLESDLLYNDRAVRFLSLALSFPERLTGRSNNPFRLNYFRMFFTDSVVDILHGGNDGRPFEDHEQELFGGALNIGFLDFFLTAVCRRIREICAVPVKPYGEMVAGRPMVIPGHPLPNDVYLTYLRSMENLDVRSPGTISNQRREYRQFLRDSLC